MKLTVLGSSAAYAGPSDACSGYLVDEGDTRILLDCGTGVISNLQHHIDLREITHIVISHMHADHFFDLVPLHHALRHLNGEASTGQPQLLLPPGGLRVVKSISDTIGVSAFGPDRAFLIDEYSPGTRYPAGPLALEFTPTEHYIPAYAIGVLGNGWKVTYSGDSRPCSGLVKAAEDADLFLCEATISDPADSRGRQGHMMAREAGETAQSAGVHRLVVTHFWPDCDRENSWEKAGAGFDGVTEIARPGKTFAL